MAQLSFVERRKLETLFEMGGGYVLDFSNRTLQEFVADSVGVEIYDERYNYDSGSKANRLRGFWKIESDANVAKLIRDLVDYAEFLNKNTDADLVSACRAIADRLVARSNTSDSENSAMSRPIRVFIAYSHDSPEHVRQVLALSDSLRRDGIDADLDQYHLSPTDGWPAWVSNQLATADFVIIVCTKVFLRRFRGEDKASIGLGVEYEGALLQETNFNDSSLFEVGRKTTRYLPVVFSNTDSAYIPPQFRALTFYNLTGPEGYGFLYRRLTNQPKLAASPIGELFKPPPRATEDKLNGLRTFLCHSSKDKPAVRDLYKKLLTHNVRPWLDEEDLLAGQIWREEIPKAIRGSHAVVVCLSANAVSKAGYFHKEVKFALDVLDEQPEGTVFVVPVRLAECDIPERLGHIHCANLYDHNGFEKLLLALQSRAKQVAANNKDI